MSFKMNRNHFCSSLPDAGLILSEDYLYRIEAHEGYRPHLMVDLSFPLCIINNKTSFYVILKEHKKWKNKFMLPISDISPFLPTTILYHLTKTATILLFLTMAPHHLFIFCLTIYLPLVKSSRS